MAKTQVVRIDKSLALFQPCDFTILCCHNNSHISCQWTLNFPQTEDLSSNRSQSSQHLKRRLKWMVSQRYFLNLYLCTTKINK